MTQVAELESKAIVGAQALQALVSMEDAEKTMLQFPQVDCPVVHHFGPNLCVREVFMPSGTLAIGHKQKFAHLNVMLKGKVLVLNDDGEMQVLSAPMMFVGKPGRKIGYILEDMVWQNIYSTDLKNPDEVEEYFIEKSEDWRQDYTAKFAVAAVSREVDRADYATLLDECNISHETALAQSENTDDLIWVANSIVRVSESPIQGKGLFVTAPVKSGEIICQARIKGNRTQAGRYTNHSVLPNAKMVLRENDDIDLVALVDIEGCKGGSIGTEIVIDYRQALTLSGIKFIHREVPCQV